MLRQFLRAAALGLFFVAGAGCSAPAWRSASLDDASARHSESNPLAETLEPAADDLADDLTDRRTGSRIAPPEGSQPPDSKRKVDERAMADMIAELQNLGPLNPAEQQELMENLKGADQVYWPQLTKYYLATLSYQRRLREMEQMMPPVPTGATQVHGAAAAVAPQGSIAQGTVQPSGDPIGNLAQAAPLHSVPLESAPLYSSSVAAVLHRSAAMASSPISEGAGDQPFSFSAAAPIVGSPVVQPASEPPTNVAAYSRTVAPSGSLDVAQVAFRPKPHAAGWRPALERTIHDLENATREPPRSTDEISQHAVLRLLYLAAGRQNDALRPIAGIPPAQQDFWSQQLYGMSVWLDSERQPSIDQRAAEAAAHLDQARTRLGEIGTLRVRNLAFCTEVNSYGVITEFESSEFEPGQEVILYAEVENFKSDPSPEGYHTALQSSYQILDSQGQRVAEHEFPTTEEYCRNPRRDFFLRYHIYIPERVGGGRYSLQLTIEDTLSRKIGQSSIELTIKP